MQDAGNVVPFFVETNMNQNLLEEYPYLYETHLHTMQGSACGYNSGAEMARACKEYGYTGIFVTDHNWGGNTAVGRSLPWDKWVRKFAKGYESAREEGERIGLDVFFGYEAGYRGTEFLIYGLDPEFMIEHPKLRSASVEEQYEIVHEGGGMVVHAHPYREEAYIPTIRLFPESIDAVEGINAMHSNSASWAHYNLSFDKQAIAYAREHALPLTAGSDIHFSSLLGGGMAFKRKIKSVADYIQIVLSGEDYLLTNGEYWYDRDGKLL